MESNGYGLESSSAVIRSAPSVDWICNSPNSTMPMFSTSDATTGSFTPPLPRGLAISRTALTRQSSGGQSLLFSRRSLPRSPGPVSYTHLRAHETKANLVCRLLLEKKKKNKIKNKIKINKIKVKQKKTKQKDTK